MRIAHRLTQKAQYYIMLISIFILSVGTLGKQNIAY